MNLRTGVSIPLSVSLDLHSVRFRIGGLPVASGGGVSGGMTPFAPVFGSLQRCPYRLQR